MAAGLKTRLERLEAAARVKVRATLPALVCINPDPIQQDEIDAAKAAGRFALVIRGTPYKVDPPELLTTIVEVGDDGGSGSPQPIFERTPMRQDPWDGWR
jgi:hypothetical protein